MFPESEQSALPSFPSLPLSNLPSPLLFLQVQVHSGVTSCLVAKDNQTPIYVTIINNSVALPTLLTLSLILLNANFPTRFLPFITVLFQSDPPCPSKTSAHPILVQKTAHIHSLSLSLFHSPSHLSTHHHDVSTYQDKGLISHSDFVANQSKDNGSFWTAVHH